MNPGWHPEIIYHTDSLSFLEKILLRLTTKWHGKILPFEGHPGSRVTIWIFLLKITKLVQIGPSSFGQLLSVPSSGGQVLPTPSSDGQEGWNKSLIISPSCCTTWASFPLLLLCLSEIGAFWNIYQRNITSFSLGNLNWKLF